MPSQRSHDLKARKAEGASRAQRRIGTKSVIRNKRKGRKNGR